MPIDINALIAAMRGGVQPTVDAWNTIPTGATKAMQWMGEQERPFREAHPKLAAIQDAVGLLTSAGPGALGSLKTIRDPHIPLFHGVKGGPQTVDKILREGFTRGESSEIRTPGTSLSPDPTVAMRKEFGAANPESLLQVRTPPGFAVRNLKPSEFLTMDPAFVAQLKQEGYDALRKPQSYLYKENEIFALPEGRKKLEISRAPQEVAQRAVVDRAWADYLHTHTQTLDDIGGPPRDTLEPKLAILKSVAALPYRSDRATWLERNVRTLTPMAAVDDPTTRNIGALATRLLTLKSKSSVLALQIKDRVSPYDLPKDTARFDQLYHQQSQTRDDLWREIEKVKSLPSSKDLPEYLGEVYGKLLGRGYKNRLGPVTDFNPKKLQSDYAHGYNTITDAALQQHKEENQFWAATHATGMPSNPLPVKQWAGLDEVLVGGTLPTDDAAKFHNWQNTTVGQKWSNYMDLIKQDYHAAAANPYQSLDGPTAFQQFWAKGMQYGLNDALTVYSEGLPF